MLILTLLLALAPGLSVHAQGAPVPSPTTPATTTLVLDVSSASGTSLDLSVGTGDGSAVFRAACLLPWDWKPLAGSASVPDGLPLAGFSLSAPGLLAGGVEPSGLRFLYRPCAGGSVLGGGGEPFAQVASLGAGTLAVQAGAGAGLFLAAPQDDPLRRSVGAWFGPEGSPVRAFALLGREPGSAGGPSWFDPPSPDARRLWAAVSCSAGDGLPALRLACAGSLGLPGLDAWAARAEGACRLGAVRLSGEASCSSRDWISPDGVGSAGYRLAADLSVKEGPVPLSLSWRSGDGWDDGPPEGSAGLRLGLGPAALGLEASAGLDLVLAPGAGPPSLDLGFSLRPGERGRLTLSGDWLDAGGEDRWRAELSLDRGAGPGMGARLEAGIDGTGPWLEGACSVGLGGPRWELELELGTRTPFRPDGRGELELSCSSFLVLP